MTVHPLDPVFDQNARVLILGSFPSVRSRKVGFYYGHPQNRFWKVLAAVCDAPVPASIDEKKAFLLANGIALWDVVGACDITGSADSSIRNALPNDVPALLAKAPRIGALYLNGRTAEAYYRRYLAAKIALPAVALPSTSPANAAFSLEALVSAWRVVRDGGK